MLLSTGRPSLSLNGMKLAVTRCMKRRVVIVEDEIVLANNFARILGAGGFEAETVFSTGDRVGLGIDKRP